MNTNFDKIIVISIDNLRADCINYNPVNLYKKKYKTEIVPNTSLLDFISEKSVFFSNCISAAPYTSVSHGAFFSGVWPIKNNLYSFFNRKIKSKLFFELARENGFKTVFQTDFPIILGKYLGLNKGVDYYFIENETAALRKTESLRRSVSFFHFAGCHYPYGFHKLKFGANDYRRKIEYLEKEFSVTNGRLDDTLSETFRNKQDHQYLLRYKRIIEHLYRKSEYDVLFNLYLEGINYFFKRRFNSFLRKAFDYVNKQNGLLVIFADHGEEWDECAHGHYNSLSRGVITVPIIFYSPENIKLARILNGRIRSIDVGATIFDMITRGSVSCLDGTSLRKIIFSGDQLRDSEAIAQIWGGRESVGELIKFQKRAMLSNTVYKPRDQYLKQETVFWNRFRLLNTYDENGKTRTSVLLDQKERVMEKTHLKKVGMSKLAHYHSFLQNKRDLSVNINLFIKEQLEGMGYNVV